MNIFWVWVLGVSLNWFEVLRDVFFIEFLVVIIDLSKSNCVFYILDILEKDVNMLLER